MQWAAGSKPQQPVIIIGRAQIQMMKLLIAAQARADADSGIQEAVCTCD